MKSANNTNSSDKKAALWLDQRELYLGLTIAGRFTVYTETWNPERLSVQTQEAAELLTSTLISLAKQHQLHRRDVRLCLDDALCVTRVVTGDTEAVQRELDAIQVRSQLYISLGLGDKLTGNLRESTDGQLEYALTSIVNQRTMQVLYNAITAARIRLDSIEPVTLSTTRGVGLLGADKDRPILLVTVDKNRCDLAITRSGRLMLSYRISGAILPQAIADQILSHMTRLRRFCQRVRSQTGSSLEQIFILGERSIADPLTEILAEATDRIQVAKLEVPNSIHSDELAGVPTEVSMALWAATQWNELRTDLLPSPDLLQQLKKLQHEPLAKRILLNFYPVAISAGLILVVSLLYWNDWRRFSAMQVQLDSVSAEVSVAEEELADWEAKQRLIANYRQLRLQADNTRLDELILAIAPCLPANTRLESLALNDDKSLSMRGTMVSGDQTYEMLLALKSLPQIGQVSLESVNAVGDARENQIQFDVRCKLSAPDQIKTNKGHLVNLPKATVPN
jgi:hypothetical protein